MGIAGTIALAVGSAIIGPKVAEAFGLGAKAPKLQMENAPNPATASPAGVPAQGAAEQQRKRAAAAGGRGSTFTTPGGAQGLGDVPAENQQTKSILGY